MNAATAPKKSLTVGNVQYVIRYAPATVSLRAAGILANAFGPLVEGMRAGKGLDARVLGGLSEVLSNPHLGACTIELCQQFAPYTEVLLPDGRSYSLGGEHGKFDEHFAGDLVGLTRWLHASVEYNLGNFLDEIGNLLRERFSKPRPGEGESSNSSGPNSPAEKPGSGA